MTDIIGKWALITGASSGLGVEFARILAEKGCNLVLVARRKELLQEVERQIHDHYENQIEVIPADLSLPDAAQKIFDHLQSKNIHIDILINNAGFGLLGRMENHELSKLQNMVDLNVKALTDFSYIFGKAMLQKNFGYILNVASTAAFQPIPNFAVYSATKSYVLSLSEALHLEFAKKNVVVTCLCPGPTDTEFFKTSGSSPRSTFLVRKSAHYVCKMGTDALLAGKLTVSTGFINTLVVFLVRFMPRRLVVNMAALTMKN